MTSMAHRLLTARRTGLAALLTGFVLALPDAASAHGIGGASDLPIPGWLFAWGATAVLILSFVALGVLWPKPRLESMGSPARAHAAALRRAGRRDRRPRADRARRRERAVRHDRHRDEPRADVRVGRILGGGPARDRRARRLLHRARPVADDRAARRRRVRGSRARSPVPGQARPLARRRRPRAHRLDGARLAAPRRPARARHRDPRLRRDPARRHGALRHRRVAPQRRPVRGLHARPLARRAGRGRGPPRVAARPAVRAAVARGGVGHRRGHGRPHRHDVVRRPQPRHAVGEDRPAARHAGAATSASRRRSPTR